MLVGAVEAQWRGNGNFTVHVCEALHWLAMMATLSRGGDLRGGA
jgi:hypothetical protein